MNLESHNEVILSSNSMEDKQTEKLAGVRPAWHRPEIVLIDLRRTMLTTGSLLDGLAVTL